MVDKRRQDATKGQKTMNKEINIPVFTKHIESLRIKEGTSIRSMATILGIDRETYARRVNSEEGLTEKDLVKAAKYFGIDLKASGREILL